MSAEFLRPQSETQGRSANKRLVDLHQDLSALRAEAGVNVYLPNSPFRETVPVIFEDEEEENNEWKWVGSTIDEVRLAGVSVLVANMYPRPTKPFDEEFAFHTQFNKDMLAYREDLAELRTREDVAKVMQDPNITGVVNGLEGIYNAENWLELPDRFVRANVRVVHQVWNFSNALGHGHPEDNEGLTRIGVEFTRLGDKKGLIFDLSHAARKTALDILSNIQYQPAIASHTGLRGENNITRNIADDVAVEVARHGGLIGITPAAFMLDRDSKANTATMVNHMVYLANILGQAGIKDPWKHIALGSDFCGTTPHNISDGIEDISQIGPAFRSEMIRRGYSQDIIEGVSHRNGEELFSRYLPKA